MKTGLLAGGIALMATLGLSFAAFAGPSSDTDTDGVWDYLDNCTTVQNAPPLDCDTDNDGYGNLCDGDLDNDMFTLGSDFSTFASDYAGSYDTGTGTDQDCDGFVFGSDFTAFLIWYTAAVTPPGPSGLTCAGTVPCDL